MQNPASSSTSSTQGDALVLSTIPEVSMVGAGDSRDEFLVMASIRAPEFKAEQRAPVDVVCVIDRSGSMSGSRLALAKETVTYVAQNLQKDDRLGIVTYDDNVQNHFPLTEMTETGRQRAVDSIKKINCGGSTNLCGGLLAGIEQLRNRKNKNEVASVLLFTDGQANKGYTIANDIIRATTDREFASRNGKSVTVTRAAPRNAPSPRAMMTPRAAPPRAMPMSPMAPMTPMTPPMHMTPMPMSPMPLAPPIMPMQQMNNPADFDMSQQANTNTNNFNNYGALPLPTPPAALMSPMAAPVPALSRSISLHRGDDVSRDAPVLGQDPLPCTINCFGFGGDHDANLLKSVADHGSGIYYYVENVQRIPEAFADCLGGIMSVVGQNISLKFEAQGTDVKVNSLITKFKTKELVPEQLFELSMTDIQSEENRDILVSMSLPATHTATTNYPVLKVTLSYFNVITGRHESSAQECEIRRGEESNSEERRNYNLDKQYNRLLAAQAMDQANDSARSGDLERARSALKSAKDRIKESVSADDEFCRNLVGDIERCESGLKSRSEWEAGGSKMLTNQMNAHFVQRSSNVQWAAQQVYSTNARAHMQTRFQK